MPYLLSHLENLTEKWHTAQQYEASVPEVSPSSFLVVTDLLMKNPNLNSSHLFRADILSDSKAILSTPWDEEAALSRCESIPFNDQTSSFPGTAQAQPSLVHSNLSLEGAPELSFDEDRRVVRRLIPRKPQLDRSLDQTCLTIEGHDMKGHVHALLVVYIPHVFAANEMPFYHPQVRGLAYLFECPRDQSRHHLSVHFLPFAENGDEVTARLHRTMMSLTQTLLRLVKKPITLPGSIESGDRPILYSESTLTPSNLKDTIIPQHLMQNTYTHLKQKYASDLIQRWVEKTEPSRHVFEDLSIAAFLIELWKQMYSQSEFPGFVDIACGNGVLVYVLLREGYHGIGLDARRRKTWDILNIDESLQERVCIPKPFLDAARLEHAQLNAALTLHSGIFPKDTFIISNHADELTPWTPILACLSNTNDPLPFLAIPCCSHALSGIRYRYNPIRHAAKASIDQASAATDHNEGKEQSKTGDLKAMRAAKIQSASKDHTDPGNKSQYACLTRKVIALAEELGADVEVTLMRIPSTRNIGIVGNCLKQGRAHLMAKRGAEDSLENGCARAGSTAAEESNRKTEVQQLIKRECAIFGGVEHAANTWIEHAQSLSGTTKGQRGKLNLGKPPTRGDKAFAASKQATRQAAAWNKTDGEGA